MSQALIIDAARTPRGKVRRDGGSLSHLAPAELLGEVLRALADRGLPTEQVDDLIVGVNTAVGEQAGDVGRVAIMAADWPDTVPAGTVSRLCCSGLDAIIAAAAQVRSGGADLAVAAGVESMSRVPMMSDRPAFALDDAVGEATGFVAIAVSADATAIRAGITREEIDQYGVRSQLRSAAAPKWESIIPVRTKDGELLDHDEGARPETTLEALSQIPPLFAEDPSWGRVDRRLGLDSSAGRGLHTVATAPQMADAASSLVIASEEWAAKHDRVAVARIAAWAHAAVRSPGLEGTVPASRLALERAGIGAADLALAEINESFSVTPLLLARELGLDAEIVNPHGGAISVGHPLAASGGIIAANAIDQLRRTGGGYALLTIPAALGIASAVVIEVFA